jgi:hypothetical protein
MKMLSFTCRLCFDSLSSDGVVNVMSHEATKMAISFSKPPFPIPRVGNSISQLANVLFFSRLMLVKTTLELLS